MRHRFVRTLTSVGEAVRLALEAGRAPVIFSDAGDNPGGGGSGRTTELLVALHAAGAAGVFYGSFHDPELAAEAHALGPASPPASTGRPAAQAGSAGIAASRPRRRSRRWATARSPGGSG